MKIPLKLILLVFLSCIFISCDSRRMKTEVLNATTKFHDGYNRSQFEDAYVDATPLFINKKASFLPYITKKRQQLGEFKSGSNTGYRLIRTNDDIRIDLRFKSEFSNGITNERFIYVANSSGLHLDEYDANVNK